MTVRKGFFVSMALAVTLITAGPASAQGLDPASQEALAATLQMLADPALRTPAMPRILRRSPSTRRSRR